MIRAFQLAIMLLALNFIVAISSGVHADDKSSLNSNKGILEEPNSTLAGNEMNQKAGEAIIETEKTVVEEPNSKRKETKVENSIIKKPESSIAEKEAEQKTEKIVVSKPKRKNKRRASSNSRVKVRAPYTSVDVDTKRRRVRIRVPYYSGDIRW